MSLLDSATQFGENLSDQITALREPSYSYGEKDYEYFLIQELNGPKKQVFLMGNQMPMDFLPFGGKQRIAKEFYSGYSEPVMHVLGPQENDTIIRGKLKDKRFSKDLKGVSREYQELLDSIRIRGNLCLFNIGEWERYGLIEEADFRVFRETEIEYEIKLNISGFNAPKNARFLEQKRLVPFDINERLIDEAFLFFQAGGDLPDGIPFSVTRLFNQILGAVAEAFAAVTSFVDGIVGTIADIKKTINKAVSLIRYAKNEMGRYISFVKNFTFDDFDTASFTQKYEIGNFNASQISGGTSLLGLLNDFESRFKDIIKQSPLRRHEIKTGDTLQSIAVKYYEDAANWTKIYEYNELSTTELTIGKILDIPKL